MPIPNLGQWRVDNLAELDSEIVAAQDRLRTQILALENARETVATREQNVARLNDRVRKLEAIRGIIINEIAEGET
jgi:hypothetical protein